MIWCCPTCRGELAGERAGALDCRACGARYDVVSGIPDFRVPGRTWIDCDEDREAARRLAVETRTMEVPEIVRRVYGSRPDLTPAMVELRTRQVLAAPDRLRHDVRTWLDGATRTPGFIDLGCGPGTLLAAAAAEGRSGIGIDVSLTWLVVAQRLIAARGGTATLAAALGEALPLPAESVPAVLSLDVIEHVGDPVAYLREIDRVTASDGWLALATPNRFSLTAEPHVFVWGVGWVPRGLQKAYVRRLSGKPYEFTRLLSTWEARHLIRRHTTFEAAFVIPQVAAEEIAHFPPWRAALARTYNRLSTLAVLRPAWLAIGPFFRVVGRKGAPMPVRPAIS